MSVIDIEDAWIVPSDDDAELFFYTPKQPGIARDANGRPQINLISTGDGGFLQVTSDWGLDSARQDEIRGDLARQTGTDATRLRLEQSRDTVIEVVLQLGDGGGAFETLKTSKSSGVPPFQSAFSAMLDGDQISRARRALSGERGFLLIRYDITRSTQGARHEFSRSESTIHTTRQNSTCGTTQSYSGEASETLAASAPDNAKISIESDAADWGLS